MQGSVTQPFTAYLTKGEDLLPAGGDHVGPSLQKLRQLCQERGVQEYLNQKFAKKSSRTLPGHVCRRPLAHFQCDRRHHATPFGFTT